MVNLVIEQPYFLGTKNPDKIGIFLVGDEGCLVTSIFLLKNLATPPRAVALRFSNPSSATQTKRHQCFH